MTATAAQPERVLDDRYELHALIGQGTFGRVFRGRDRRLERSVAVKVIKPWWTEDPKWARRFEREAQLMARINHPGIVQIYDIGYGEQGLYYVAELVEGESLAERLRRGRLSPAQARDVAKQLCRALAQAHAERVVHRDVKPGNVLIARDGRVKVGDFGIARLAEGTDGFAGTVLGTPRYMAPEQARGRPPTPATDVYGAGIVLYEMLAGRPPFVETAAVEVALRHLSDPPPPLPPRTPPSLVAIVERALAKEPGKRYPSGREMADALAAADLGGAAAPATAPPCAPRIGAPGAPARTRVGARRTPRRTFNPAESRRYRALFVTIVVLVLATIAATVLTSTSTVRVPELRGLSRTAAETKLRAQHLHATFAPRYDSAPRSTAIAQRPAPGVRVSDGTTLRVVLSAGPPPVAVPQVVGRRSADAQAILSGLGLTANVAQVAAPGVTPGLVVRQSPGSSADLASHSTVALSVAETPRWRPLTAFSADRSGQSEAFRIEGSRWRVVYSMGYDGTCTLIFFCSGPSASVTNVATGSTVGQFDLAEGSGQAQVFSSGPGVYQIAITSGSDSAHWSVRVQDDY